MPPPSTKPLVAAALPGTVVDIIAKSGLVESTVRRHLCTLRDEGKAHIKKRRRAGGRSSPVWVEGPGKDAPIPAPLGNAGWCRRHRKRVRKAIAKAQAGGKEDPRYIRHIRLKQVDAKVKQAKAEPQTWISALM